MVSWPICADSSAKAKPLLKAWHQNRRHQENRNTATLGNAQDMHEIEPKSTGTEAFTKKQKQSFE